MTLNISTNSTLQQRQQNLSFKGLESIITGAAQAVQTQPIVEYTGVDLASMIIPRTAIDFTRGTDAGIETARRETTALANDCLVPGWAAAGVGALLGKFIAKGVDIKAFKPIDSETIDVAHKAWSKAAEHHAQNPNKDNILESYFQHLFDNSKGVVGTQSNVSFAEPSRIIPEEQSKTLAQRLVEVTKQEMELEKREKSKSISIDDSIQQKKEIKAKLKSIKQHAIDNLGASERIYIDESLSNTQAFTNIAHEVTKSKDNHIKTTMPRLIDNLRDMGKEFYNSSSPDEIAQKVGKHITINKYKAISTIALMCATGLSLQYLNRQLTKKKTGSDAFVGISAENRTPLTPEEKSKLNFLKGASVLGMLGLMATTITGQYRPWKIIEGLKPKNLLKKLEFNSYWPNANQLKLIYGTVLIGRMLAASDKHELRETDTRDFPGFLNWLVLGGVVSKFVGRFISRTSKDNKETSELLNYASAKPEKLKSGTIIEKAKNLINRIIHFITDQSLRTHSEIKAEMIKKGNELGKNLVNSAEHKKLNWKLNGAIGAGLLYSTLALGVFMPWFNKHVTNKLTEKKKFQAKLDVNNTTSISQNSASLKDASPLVKDELFADFLKNK